MYEGNSRDVRHAHRFSSCSQTCEVDQLQNPDNTQTGSATVAIDKARTAALFKRPSKAFQDLVAGGGSGLRILGLTGAMPIAGGVPLVSNNLILGAIGVSGESSSEHDDTCAQVGAGALK
jgi:glc operon protein GlcG